MTPAHQPHEPLVFISAAEPSADRHGAALIRATHALAPNVRFVGVAGPNMVNAGCDRIFDMTSHAAMLLGVVGAVPRAIRLLNTADRYLRRYPFDAAVVIDSPTLHFPLAFRAKRAGVPVLYYIAPQLWAWGSYRIHKLRHSVDQVAAILPFEQAYFRNQGVDATFVGHPLADTCGPDRYDNERISKIRQAGRPVVALLPGSRTHVVSELLPGQIAVARAILSEFPEAHVGVSVAHDQLRPIVEAAIRRSTLRLHAYPQGRTELIRAADLVLVASGTSTLEVAMHERPMIVMYNASRVFYHLVGRWMIHAPHLALPNILAGREIVPEFMPYYRSTEPITRCAIHLLKSEPARRAMVDSLRTMVAPLKQPRASERTADLLLSIIERSSAPE